MNEIATVLAVA